MSGSTDSETQEHKTHDGETRDGRVQDPVVQAPQEQDKEEQDKEAHDRETPDREEHGQEEHGQELQDGEVQDPEDPDDEDQDPEIRRARWTAVGTGALLAVAGLAASAMRSTTSTRALIPLSYASGAVLCAGASVLGSKGRTRRALWLMIVGVMVMAVGDQLD
ncbi:hypothetical protein [Streptomyces sp. NPDC086182]|jgi:hypothetical protein|uniref:hypothetical protein n=1 Tax=Streptomyces sp. NPDC086182 TaxID=3155058 RepID=UPI00344313C1